MRLYQKTDPSRMLAVITFEPGRSGGVDTVAQNMTQLDNISSGRKRNLGVTATTRLLQLYT